MDKDKSRKDNNDLDEEVFSRPSIWGLVVVVGALILICRLTLKFIFGE